MSRIILRKEPRRQVQIYLRRVFLPPPLPVLANIYSILAYDIPRTEDVGPALHPLRVQCRSIVYDAGPTLIYHRVCCILCASTWHSPNAVSMLTHSLRRWPVSETALGECTVFSDCFIMRVTLCIPAPETPNNTIHWPNADVMLCHRYSTLFQPKPFRLWTTNIFVTIFFEHLLKTKVLNLRTWNVILHNVHKDWCTEMWAVSHTQHSTLSTAGWDKVSIMLSIMRVTLCIPAPETPDNTIHWPNADVMLCHRYSTLFQPKPFGLLTTNIFVTIFFWTLVKDKST